MRVLIIEDEPVIARFLKQGLVEVGIRADDLERIFAPLYRSNALAHKSVGSTGLGLSIVAKACELLGITTSVASELGRGTEFMLRFPA